MRNEDQDYKKFEEGRWDKKDQKLAFRHEAALEIIRGVQTKSVLDVGCGDGVFEDLLLAQHTGITCAGVDLSEVAIRKAKSKQLPAIFEVADVMARGLPYKDCTYETVVALDVLEHVFAPVQLVREMGRVASRDLIVAVPNFSSLPARIQTLFGKVPENNLPHKGHVFWFNWDVLQEVIHEAGYEVSEIKMNYYLGSRPIIGSLARFAGKYIPNLLALSFVARLRKKV